VYIGVYHHYHLRATHSKASETTRLAFVYSRRPPVGLSSEKREREREREGGDSECLFTQERRYTTGR